MLSIDRVPYAAIQVHNLPLHQFSWSSSKMKVDSMCSSDIDSCSILQYQTLYSVYNSPMQTDLRCIRSGSDGSKANKTSIEVGERSAIRLWVKRKEMAAGEGAVEAHRCVLCEQVLGRTDKCKQKWSEPKMPVSPELSTQFRQRSSRRHKRKVQFMGNNQQNKSTLWQTDTLSLLCDVPMTPPSAHPVVVKIRN